MTANTLIFRCLLAVLVLAPLPLGSHRPWAWSLLAVLVAVLLIVWSGLVFRGHARAPVAPRRLWPIAAPFMLALAWAALQTSPWMPADWLHPLWAETARALPGEAVTGRITVDPALTWTAILRLASYAGVFWLAVQLGRDRQRARTGLVVLSWTGIAYAAYGLAAHFSGTERILWLEKWAYLGDLSSTFVNRNAYGAYAGLGLLGCLTLLIHSLRDRGRLRDTIESALTVGAPLLAGASVIATALLLSHSRGALLASATAVMLLLVALTAGRVVRPRLSIMIALLVGLGGGALSVTTGNATLDRLVQSTEIEGDRGNLYRLTLTAIGDAPWTGHGLGAYLPAFRVYRDTSLNRPVIYDFAHNQYLETAMDLGWPTALLFYAALAGAAGLCLIGLRRRRRDQIHPAMALAGTVLLGTHGLVDFSASMPAIGATYAYLLGVGVAQSWTSVEEAEELSR